MACAPSEDSDHPGHPPSLIRVFAVRMKKAWVVSYPLSATAKILIRLGGCPGWSEFLLGAYVSLLVLSRRGSVNRIRKSSVLGIDIGCAAWQAGERGGSVVECRTPEREVWGSKPTSAVLCPWARHFTPRKYWLITQEAVAPSRHVWKIVDWDVKPQHKQTNKSMTGQHKATRSISKEP